ncbi:MAG: cysteine hydrolase [Chloroflexi bacterium]|nr:cysteine hydrolase [Chloroflexota bacterium]
MPEVVLVMDMVRGFLEEGHPLYYGADVRKIIPNVRQLLDREMGRDVRIFFVCDRHRPGDKTFAKLPPHCLEGTPEADLIPELAGYPGEVVPKRRNSAFFGTGIDAVLNSIRPEKIIVCGILTENSVMHTVADARSRDYAVEVPADCVASPDYEAHRFALKHMERALGATMTRAVPKASEAA